MRRKLLLAGVLLACVGLASVFIFSGISPALALRVSTEAPTSTPTATAAPGEPSPPGGLGNTRADVEKVLGRPTGLKGTMIAYGEGTAAVSYTDGRAVGILVPFDIPPASTLAARRKAVQRYLPTDGVFVGTMAAGPGRTADVYRSQRLADKVAPPNSQDPKGQFVVIYEFDQSGTLKDALLSVGGIPTQL